MNRREERKHRRALTALVSIYIFIIMLITIAIAFATVLLLVYFDLVPLSKGGFPDHKYALIFMMLINLGVGLCVTALSSQITLKYVNRIINQMNRLASGDFKARLNFGEPLNLHPTIKEVTESFNRMAEELDNTKMLRGDFINNFSHEFKTPIVSIAGFTKLLKRGNLTEEQKGEYLDIIEEESLRLSTMATNVLNVTKIENQTILTDTSTYNLSEQIRSCVLLLENKWVKKNIELNLEFDEHDIHANEELMKQVWINLLDNAIKFSPEYGEVVVKIMEEPDFYKISVANAGIEIPEESRKRIFDKFYQADESHSSEGNGIGLAIVKEVVNLHKGEISVDCKNGITTFSVIIPKIFE